MTANRYLPAVSDERADDVSSRAEREDGSARLVAAEWPEDLMLAEEPIDVSDLTVQSIARLLTLVRDDLAAVFKHDATPEQLLDHVVRVATNLVPGAEDAGITLASGEGLQTVAAVGDTALAIDDIQRALGSGPAEDVVRDGRTLRVPDLMADLRWGQFGVRAADEGVLPLLACPLPLPRRRAGVLSLYGARPAAFDAAAELVVPVFGEVAVQVTETGEEPEAAARPDR
jgi:GAF domain-containing protein